MTEVQTVIGKISGAEMGFTLPHEHVFIDLNCLRMKASCEYEWIVDRKVSLDMFGTLLHHPRLCKDNLVLDNPEIAIRELEKFKSVGGRTLVDMTSRGLLPRPLLLRQVAKRTGINIISGCGYYVSPSHPPDMDARTVDELTEEIISDISVGIGGTAQK